MALQLISYTVNPTLQIEPIFNSAEGKEITKAIISFWNKETQIQSW